MTKLPKNRVDNPYKASQIVLEIVEETFSLENLDVLETSP